MSVTEIDERQTTDSVGADAQTRPAATACIDGNEAAAKIAYALSEVIAIYPITPRPRWVNSPTRGRPAT